jgi:hypothetical protein
MPQIENKVELRTILKMLALHEAAHAVFLAVSGLPFERAIARPIFHSDGTFEEPGVSKTPYQELLEDVDVSNDEGQAEANRVIRWEAMSIIAARIVVEASEYAGVAAEIERAGNRDPYSGDDAEFESLFESFFEEHMKFDDYHCYVTEAVNETLQLNPGMMKAIRRVAKALFNAGEEATPASEIHSIVDACMTEATS